MVSGPFRLHVSDVRVEIAGAPDAVVRGLRAVWSACEVPILPASRDVRFEVERGPGGWRVHRDGRHVGGSASDEGLLPGIERALYASLLGWHPPPRVILHASAVAFGATALVLAGPSGAGKSAMARALVARGGRYLSDELVITDGQRVWGIPRAIQFDAVPAGAPPPWLGDADLESYRWDEGGRSLAMPLVAPARVQLAPLAAGRARIVLLERGPRSAIREASPVEALAELHAGAFSPLATDLGALARTPLRLTWDRPDAAADALLGACAAGEAAPSIAR